MNERSSRGNTGSASMSGSEVWGLGLICDERTAPR